MSEKILVPIKIEALAVDEITATDSAYNWKNFAMDYEGLAAKLGTYMEPVGLKELSQGGFCEKGIHLHWALPAALTNAIHKNNKAIFPAVPNRWLVIRTHLVNDKPVTNKWLIESDYISEELQSDKSTWAMQKPDGSFSTSHNIGQTTVLDDWTAEQPRSENPLTAVAPGNATFAAIYQYCRNVFGFWDDLAGVEKTATVFSYLVTGWYSDPAIEPLQNSDKDIIDNIKSKWSLEELSETDAFPTSILCHGLIHSVAWNPKQHYELPARAAQVNTGVGITSVEAKTAQLSRQTGAAEKLLSGYLYDTLKDMVDATAMDTQVESHGFTPYDGGTLWEIKRVERETQTKESKDADMPSFPSPTTNPGLSEAFKKINTEQQAADKLRQQKKSLMLEFRALCDKITMAQSSDDDGKEKLIAALTASRNLIKNDIDVIKATIAQHEAEVNKQAEMINKMAAFVATASKKAEFELVQKKMPRFWQPNDPVVLFSGPGVTKSLKYKNPNNDQKLPCRKITSIISGIVLNDGDVVDNKTIAPENISLGLKPIGSLTNNIEIITWLYKEAILLDPNWAMVWGKQYYKDSPGNVINAQKLGEYLNVVLEPSAPNKKLKALMRQDGVAIPLHEWETGVELRTLFGTLGIQRWQHPWTPLYMVWYVKFVPSYVNKDGQWQYKQADWEWKDKQYQYKGAPPDVTGAIEYAGKVLLSDLITDVLQKRFPEGMDLGQQISQALGSFSDALLMRRQCIQLPLLRQQQEGDDSTLMPDTSFADYLTNEAYFLPEINAKLGKAANFFPLRAGHLQFTRLWITDTFGQVKKVIDSDDRGRVERDGMMHIAENLNVLNREQLVTLSPRIIQPTRLSFRWCAANTDKLEESSSDPSTSPVCGWILPDYLDQSLDIYEATGEKCGSLKMTTVGAKVQLQWHTPPGIAATANPAERITNRYLLNFVKGLLDFRDNENQPAGGEALRHLFDLCTGTALFLDASTAQQSPGIAGLMGQPVALVRASLKLELLGLPAQPQNNEHTITEEIKKQPPGLSNLSFPVALGDSRNSKDGMIGYFIDKSDKGFAAMHIAFGMKRPPSNYFNTNDIMLTFSEVATGVTILMDPRGGVQADAGLLPSNLITLPPVHTEQGLKHMELDMMVAPFLGSLVEPFIPVGAEPNRQWVLKQKTKDGNWKQANVDNQTPLQTGSLNTQVIQEGYLSLQPVPPNNN